jgi:hypothetical protein
VTSHNRHLQQWLKLCLWACATRLISFWCVSGNLWCSYWKLVGDKKDFEFCITELWNRFCIINIFSYTNLPFFPSHPPVRHIVCACI